MLLQKTQSSSEVYASAFSQPVTLRRKSVNSSAIFLELVIDERLHTLLRHLHHQLQAHHEED